MTATRRLPKTGVYGKENNETVFDQRDKAGITGTGQRE